MNPATAHTPTSAQSTKVKHAATISGWDEALRLLGVLAVGTIIWLIPPPGGVEPRAWHLLAIFVATIVGIIAKPLPMGAIALLGIAMTALTGTLTINQALSGFGNSTIWLIVVAFFISRALSKRVWAAVSPICSWQRLGKKRSAWVTA
jgi:DASS family divalent anion:Na+ symporter